MKYTHIDGSIFHGDKQLLVVVAVECKPSLRNQIISTLIDILNKEKRNGRRKKAASRIGPGSS